jgi:hypothetical protein
MSSTVNIRYPSGLEKPLVLWTEMTQDEKTSSSNHWVV